MLTYTIIYTYNGVGGLQSYMLCQGPRVSDLHLKTSSSTLLDNGSKDTTLTNSRCTCLYNYKNVNCTRFRIFEKRGTNRTLGVLGGDRLLLCRWSVAPLSLLLFFFLILWYQALSSCRHLKNIKTELINAVMWHYKLHVPRRSPRCFHQTVTLLLPQGSYTSFDCCCILQKKQQQLFAIEKRHSRKQTRIRLIPPPVVALLRGV